MIDYTKVKPGDRFRVVRRIGPEDEVGKELVSERFIEDSGFRAHDGHIYIWDQVAPITEPALITRPIEGMPEWLANTKKSEAVKCTVWDSLYEGRKFDKYIVGYSNGLFIDSDGVFWRFAKPWTEPEPSLFTPEQLAELDARYGRRDA